MSQPSLEATTAATRQRVDDIFERLFEEGDGGAIGQIQRTLAAKADVVVVNDLKSKVDNLTWRSAYASGAGAVIVFGLRYGISKIHWPF